MDVSNSDLIISLILGQGAPYLIDFMNKRVPSSTARFWLSMAGCIALGGVMKFDEISKISLTNVGDFLALGGLVFASAQTAYKTYYKDSPMQLAIRGKKQHFDFSVPETGVVGLPTVQPDVQ